MAAKIVDTLLPTTMVGSYPRPHWFKHQLLARDIRVAFKEVQHEEAYDDAVATTIRDQEEAGLDIVTDGNMWYDDYVGVIGSFFWDMYERVPGVAHARGRRRGLFRLVHGRGDPGVRARAGAAPEHAGRRRPEPCHRAAG